MLIQDLSFIEQTEADNSLNGGSSAFTSVDVSAFGSRANADAVGFGIGNSTGAGTSANTRSASGNYFQVGSATGTATAYGVTVDGKNSRVASSVTTGIATSVFAGF